jgi:hypothetical protein
MSETPNSYTFWLGQAIHYGLPLSYDEDALKKDIRARLDGDGGLVVPSNILKLSSKLQDEAEDASSSDSSEHEDESSSDDDVESSLDDDEESDDDDSQGGGTADAGSDECESEDEQDEQDEDVDQAEDEVHAQSDGHQVDNDDGAYHYNTEVQIKEEEARDDGDYVPDQVLSSVSVDAEEPQRKLAKNVPRHPDRPWRSIEEDFIVPDDSSELQSDHSFQDGSDRNDESSDDSDEAPPSSPNASQCSRKNSARKARLRGSLAKLPADNSDEDSDDSASSTPHRSRTRSARPRPSTVPSVVVPVRLKSTSIGIEATSQPRVTSSPLKSKSKEADGNRPAEKHIILAAIAEADTNMDRGIMVEASSAGASSARRCKKKSQGM